MPTSPPPPPPAGTRRVELVSIVVPAWNEEPRLPATLRALHEAAEGLAYEIVVADDASTDRTAEVAREHGARVVRCEHRRISATRNTGARAARGDLLVFVDADTHVPRATLRAAVRAIEEGAAFGGAEIEFDAPPPWTWRLFTRALLLAFRIAGYAAGAFLFCTREAFERVGGFDERYFAGEEVELSRALKRVGRHAWVREPVVTSGRKLRTFSTGELLAALARFALGGRRLARRLRHDLWYGERRPDPHEPAA